MSTSTIVSRSTARLAALAGLLAVCAGVSGQAAARTLEEVRAVGTISLCASPETLPYASDKPGDPGFQVELGRAIAAGLGLGLSIEWIVPRRRANVVNCDMQLDSVNDAAMQKGRALLTKPYQRSGVALGLARGVAAVADYKDLRKDQKIGVMVSSVASVVLGKQGATTSPYAFQSDMIEDLVKGDLHGGALSIASLSYYIHTHPEAGLSLAYAFDSAPELTWEVAIGLRKSDDALVQAVNQVLDTLLSDGTITRIYAKYGVEHRRP
ncbi:MAG: transporter substrate-binding domain-containing protein [Burkholderiales bacterium]